MPKKSTQAISVTTSPIRPSIFDRFENQVLWHYVILIVATFFIYVKAVGFEFINSDDVLIIVRNIDTLSHWRNIGTAFKTDAFLNTHGAFYRPVQTISFMLDASISGDRPWMYHLSSVLYHLITVVSLYSLLHLLKFKNITAFFLTFFFAIHPLLSPAISWIPARGDVLIGLWGVLLLHYFIRFTATGSRRYLILNAVLFILAIFTKETGVLFPPLFVVYYLFVSKDKISLQKMAPLFIIWAIVYLLFFMLRHNVVSSGYAAVNMGLDSLLSNIVAIPILLAKTLVPVSLSTLPLFENTFTIAGILLMILIVLVLIKNIATKQWLPVVGFAWFIAFIVPTLLFRLDNSHFILDYYEYRIYLPMIGFCIFLGFLLDTQLRKSAGLKFAWLAVVVNLIFIPLASLHTDDFKDSSTFFSSAAAHNNPNAYSVRGMQYFGNRDFANALADFNEAIAISDGQYALPLRYRAMVEIQNKDHQAAETDLTNSILLDTSSIDTYIDRAQERITLQNIDGAMLDLNKAKRIDSTNARLYYITGKLFIATRNFNAAIVYYTKAIALDSLYTEAYDERAFAYYQVKDFRNGIKDCDKTISLNKSYFTAYYNKGIIYYEMNEPDVAIKLFDTTLAITNNLYYGYFYRGMAKKQKNDMEGACKDWNQSLSLGFTLAQDTIKRYCK